MEKYLKKALKYFNIFIYKSYLAFEVNIVKEKKL